MNHQKPIDIMLNLIGTSVVGYQVAEGYIWLELKLLNQEISCPYCPKNTRELHQTKFVSVRDLPISGQPVYLKVPRRRFYCRFCQRYVTERLDFIPWRSAQTKRYEDNVYQRVLSSSIEQVSREESLSYRKIDGIFKRVSQSVKKKDWSRVERVSMDEISVRKGYRDFVTLVSHVDTGNLLEVIDSHKQSEIIDVLKQQPLSIREQVKEVSVDMWGGFPKVIEEVFPNAVVVFDRFHVMKLLNQQLNKLRNLLGIKTKGSRYLLLKNFEELTAEQKSQLASVLNQSEILKIAYELKSEFRSIYERSKTVKSGYNRFKKWLRLAQIIYGKAAETIRNHLDGICNYFMNRTTSGVMEGVNNKAKLILRQGYGFSDFEHFRARLLGSFSD